MSYWQWNILCRFMYVILRLRWARDSEDQIKLHTKALALLDEIKHTSTLDGFREKTGKNV